MVSPDEYRRLCNPCCGHHRHQHYQFPPHLPPAPSPAPPDQDINFFNHLTDMHPPLPYSPSSPTALSETELSDSLLMDFLFTPIDNFFYSSLPSTFGSGIEIGRGDASNVSHDGGSCNDNAIVKILRSKVPRGLLLFRDEVYDIDGRTDGELPPQLEVRPIAKYVSDPGLVLVRQIAANRSYICYGLKMGNIRVLNISSALRSSLRGHT